MPIKLTQPAAEIESTNRINLGKEQTETSFPEVLTQQEAAQYLRISVPSLIKLTKRNELPSRKIGTRVIYGRDALKKWVNEN